MILFGQKEFWQAALAISLANPAGFCIARAKNTGPGCVHLSLNLVS